MMKSIHKIQKTMRNSKQFSHVIISISILSFSIFSSLLTITTPSSTPEPIDVDTILNEYGSVNQSSLDEYNEFVRNWEMDELNKITLSRDLPDFEEAFKGTIFDNWIDEDIIIPLKTGTISTKQDEGLFQTMQYSLGNDWEQYEETTIKGRTQTILIEPDLEELENITIPLRPLSEIKQAQAKTIVVDKTVKIGLNIGLPRYSKTINRRSGPMGIRAWVKFVVWFRFVFPIQLRIEYPEEVFEDTPSYLKCRLIPLDLPNFNEVNIEFDISIGAEIRAYLPKFGWKTKKINLGFKKIKIKWPKFSMKWQSLVGGYIGKRYKRASSFCTPMAGQKQTVYTYADFDVLSYIPHPVARSLSRFLKAGLSLGRLTFYGQGIGGKLSVYSGSKKFSNNVRWMNSGDTKELSFKISNSEQESVKFVISNLIFHAKKMVLTPNVFMYLKDQSLTSIGMPKFSSKFKSFTKKLNRKYIKLFGNAGKIPLSKLGQLRFNLFDLNLGSVNIPARFSYASTSAFTTGAVYDFSMNVEEITPSQDQGALTGINPNDHLYRINLRNLGGRSDTLEFEISGLPSGYTAMFDRSVPHYGISPHQSEALLVISPPEHISTPPGNWNFNLKATSRAKRSIGLTIESTSQSVSLEVPEVVDLNLELEANQSEALKVLPNQYIPLKFYGENWGNLNDTIRVNASLITDGGNQTWEDEFPVDPYGSGSNHHLNGEFGFNFQLNEIYPSPGLYPFEIQATSLRNPLITEKIKLFLNFSANYDIEASITPVNTTIFANWVTNFTLTLNNTGNVMDNFTLVSDGWDDYLTFPEELTYLYPMEKVEVTVCLSITDPDLIPNDTYSFRIRAISQASLGTVDFFVGNVNVKVHRPDYVPPGIELSTYNYAFEPFLYPENTPLTLGPTWKAYDEWPNQYEIFIDDFLYQSGSWLEDTPIFAPTTGSNSLVFGDHNITITFDDLSGNVANYQVWVNISNEDLNDPVIVPDTNILTYPVNFVGERFLTWNCSDNYLLNVTIYRNETALSSTDYYLEQEEYELNSWRTLCILKPGTLTEGIWNYTLVVQDMSNNLAKSTLFVTITTTDVDIPSIFSWPSTSAYQARDESTSITASDSNADRYELTINSVLIFNESWQSGEALVCKVDELNLSIGMNNFSIFYYDLAGNSNSFTWSLNFIDIDPPILVSSLPDCVFFENNMSSVEIPYWQIFDLNPSNYSIYRNSILIESGSWTIANPYVYLPISNLSAGVYHYDVYFNDTSGNTLYSPVDVTIRDILAPFIWPQETIEYEPYHTANWVEFSFTELHPDHYQIFRNGSLIQNGALLEEFPIIFMELGDLDPNNYIFRLRVVDESDNIAELLVLVKALDYSPPAIKMPSDLVYSEGTTGHQLIWEIIEENPQSHAIFRNGTEITQGELSTSEVEMSIDGLELGFYEFVFIVYDQQGLSVSSVTYVSVIDVTPPSITHLADCRFVAGDMNAILMWSGNDLHPSSIILRDNDQVLRNDSWNGDMITIPVLGWSIGVHNVQLTVKDTSGNEVIDEVRVEIVREEEITIFTVHQTSNPEVPQSTNIEFYLILFGFIIISFTKKKSKKKRK